LVDFPKPPQHEAVRTPGKLFPIPVEGACRGRAPALDRGKSQVIVDREAPGIGLESPLFDEEELGQPLRGGRPRQTSAQYSGRGGRR
jgi:hypothetical protein